MEKAKRKKSLLGLGILVALLIVESLDLLQVHDHLAEKKQRITAKSPSAEVTENKD